MAKTDKTEKIEETVEAPKKVHLTILDEKGQTMKPNLMQLNRDAHALHAGKEARRKGILKRVTDYVTAELKRA